MNKLSNNSQKTQSKPVRVRFAPSPTGYMHLGNVRAALINYLFARQKKGTFILRIEDTDKQRNFDKDAEFIIQDLAWLNLDYTEGPFKDGPCESYIQSQRSEIHKEYLHKLKEKKQVYRCFCTPEELEAKRKRQITLKQPPRYDKICLELPESEIQEKLQKNCPFIWRFKLDHTKTIIVNDLARKHVTFNLSNFSDFPLTRQDGSFTFMFANFVDDYTMKITHIFRGEDHLTNTAGQAALYDAFNVDLPIFYHMPILCNEEGKKLSKRDFGFSLNDLKEAGFLPEAIDNYLAIIGGSFKEEIMSLTELAHAIDFDNLSSTGYIRYDVEKLRWINHQWILKLTQEELLDRVLPFLKTTYPASNTLSSEELLKLISFIQSEMVTLKDSILLVEFYFNEPIIEDSLLEEYKTEGYKNLIKHSIDILNKIDTNKLNTLEEHFDPQDLISFIKSYAKEHNLSIKKVFTLLRIILTGKAQGPGIKDLFFLMKRENSINRFKHVLQKI